MSPNLFVATQTLFSPHKWFRNNKAERPTRRTERWELPVPGIYEYIPGRGWYIVATIKDASANVPELDPKEGGPVTSVDEVIKMPSPVPVRYSKVLKRYMLDPDYRMRKKYGTIPDSRGKLSQVGFFQLDDGVAWVNCWDAKGEFIPGPYKLWCIDAKNDQFRHMLRGDDPEYQRSQANSRVNSRANSFDQELAGRRSQESRSTQYRSGPGSTRDGPSVPSTRANSVQGLTSSNPTSKPSSQVNSRRGSPTRGQRSPRLPLDEAKAALSKVAQERAAKERLRADADSPEQRGRSEVRVA